MGMCGHQPSAPRHRSSDISAGQTEAQSKTLFGSKSPESKVIGIFLKSIIYSKQGRDETLSSRKLSIGRKNWICHVEELEKLLVPRLFNFRSRFLLLLNWAFSKKTSKKAVNSEKLRPLPPTRF